MEIAIEIPRPVEFTLTTPTSTPLSEKVFALQKKAELRRQDIVNEYENVNTGTELKPLKSVVVKTRYGSILDVTKDLSEKLSYLARTRELEYGTARTKALQDIADEMTQGTDIQTRVVVMNKGRELNGFVLPDGTIFFSQSLINGLGNLDEIGAVIAHEIGHLNQDTFGKKQAYSEEGISGDINTWAIGRIHEMAADNREAHRFLEKAGLNTLAFSSAIQKISGPQGGITHQSGYVRSAQSVGVHWGVDFTTSSKNPTAKPAGLEKQHLKKTNLELAQECIETKEIEKLRFMFKRCHPRDAQALYATISKSIDKPGEKEILQAYNDVFISRMMSRGYSKNESLLFLLSVEGGDGNRYILSDYQNVIGLSKEFLHLVEKDTYKKKMDEIEQDVFQDQGVPRKNVGLQILELLRNYMFDLGFERLPNGIPVTKDLVFEVLETMNEVKKIYKTRSEQDPKHKSSYTNFVRVSSLYM